MTINEITFLYNFLYYSYAEEDSASDYDGFDLIHLLNADMVDQKTLRGYYYFNVNTKQLYEWLP